MRWKEVITENKDVLTSGVDRKQIAKENKPPYTVQGELLRRWKVVHPIYTVLNRALCC